MKPTLQTYDFVTSYIPFAMSYSEYIDLVKEKVLLNSHTGPEPSESLNQYTVLNDTRMKRLEKTLKIPLEIEEKVKRVSTKQTWLVITESWCGDAAQTMPAMQKLASLNENINLKVILRDTHPSLMDAFLTHGTRSIPKLIALDEDQKKVVGTWGPRPSVASKMVLDYKTEHGKLTPEFKKDLQVWYNKDKGQNTFYDLAKLLD